MSPALTVVVASFRDPSLLAACLDSLEEARRRVAVPVIVARRGSGDDLAALIEGRPWVRVVPAPEDADVPRLRGVAMQAADPGWVAVTEDHCVADPGWIAALVEGLDESCPLVGGGMGNARSGAMNWGAYFSEYGFFSSARPAADGAVLITGANVAYGPDLLERVTEWAASGLWEDVIHGRLAAAGVRARFLPEARILQNDTYRLGAFVADRYRHGRDYAQARMAETSGRGRLVRLLSTPLLPAVLLRRVARASAGEDEGAFLRALPFTLTFLTAWSVGEAVGYLRGVAR